MLLFFFRCFPNDLPDILFAFQARQHHFMPATCAPDFKIHSRAQNQKGLASTGMFFFHLQEIPWTYIHAAVLHSIKIGQSAGSPTRLLYAPVCKAQGFALAVKLPLCGSTA